MKTELLQCSYGVDPSEIQKLYKWPFSVTKNTKLRMFQFNINHNIIYTKDKLKRAKITTDDLCYLSKSERCCDVNACLPKETRAIWTQ